MKPYRIALPVVCGVLILALSACGGGGGGGGDTGPSGGNGSPGAVPGAAPGAGGGWETITVLPGSVPASEASYFPLADMRRAELQARFPTVQGTVEGAVEILEGAPFFRFTLQAEDKTYKVEGIPEASHVEGLFASPVIHADQEPQTGASVTVMGELIGEQLIANYVAVEGAGVWFYRSFLNSWEVREEIKTLYDGLPVAARGMLNSVSPNGEFYKFDPNRSIPSEFISNQIIVVGIMRTAPRTPYVEATGIFMDRDGTYMPVLE